MDQTPPLVIFRMYGLFQTVFYFGYMALFSLALGIICGKSNHLSVKTFLCVSSPLASGILPIFM